MLREPSTDDIRFVTDSLYSFRPPSREILRLKLWERYAVHRGEDAPENQPNHRVLIDIAERLENLSLAYRDAAVRSKEEWPDQLPPEPFAALRYQDPPDAQARAQRAAFEATRDRPDTDRP